MSINLDFPRLDDQQDKIIIRPADDAWGPYSFDVSGALPSGVTVSSAEATAYLDNGDGTYSEVASLIEPGSPAVTVTGDTTLQLKLQGKDSEGAAHAAGDYYLKLTLTLSNSGIKTLVFGPIIVESCA